MIVLSMMLVQRLGMLVLGSLFLLTACSSGDNGKVPQEKPALSVTLTKPVSAQVPLNLVANGSIAAWDEITISSEISGLQLATVLVEVGQTVHKGQVLAEFNRDIVRAEIDQSKANLEVANASAEEARLNADRARQSREKLAMSGQQIARYLAEEKMSQAKLQAAQANLKAQQVRMNNTQVLAMDDGVISGRMAAIGGVYNVGQELFRLIRQQRLEWRAEVNATEINHLQTGMPVTITVADVGVIKGVVRMIAPSLNPSSRQALVYVDLPQAMAQGFRSGMFARGEFQYGDSLVLLVPQAAVLFRDGFHYLFTLEKQENGLFKAHQLKVEVGEVVQDQIGIRAGIDAEQNIVAAGVAFLNDGDWVKVVAE